MSGSSQYPKKEAIVPRYKNVQFMSISPLDRLLNQRALDDNVRVQVSCKARNGSSNAVKDYDITMKKAQINMETCWDKTIPNASEKCEKDTNEKLECDAGEPYQVELFDLRAQRIQSLPSPPTLGSFVVTREMMECLPDDTLKIHFEYGKRQELAGAVACFDHKDYIRTGVRSGMTQTIEDEIPFTILNICNKDTTDRKRCFLYSYQITLHVQDVRDVSLQLPLIQPRVYSKITFKSIKKKMIILPGDQLKARFVTDYTDQESVRIQPEIHSPNMPSPLKERYQMTNGVTRLPCDDQKVADSIVCTNYEAHCTEPKDKILFTLQGAGDIFVIDQTCEEFLSEYQPWGQLQNILDEDFSKFESAYKQNGVLKKFPLRNVTFKNKFSEFQTEDDWFEFEYSVWWRMHSNEPRCFAGDHLTSTVPVCDLQCSDQQCLLKGPPSPHKDNRLLAADMSPEGSIRKRFLQDLAGPDVSAPEYAPGPLPLRIPTRNLNPQKYVVPERLLQIFLSNYGDSATSSSRRINMIETEVEEGVAAPINLSASFEEFTGTTYNYNVTDKVRLDNSPPASIQITELPKNGKILTQKLEGGTQELKVGDFITTEAMSEFQYDQGEEVCTKDNKDNCKDSFSYVTYSSWVGQGPESEAVINLTPVAAVQKDTQSPQNESTEPQMKESEQKAAAPVAPPSRAQAQYEPKADLKSVQMPQIQATPEIELMSGGDEMAGLDGICLNQYPTALVNFLTIVIVLLITAIAGIVSYYFYSKRQGVSKKQTSEEFDDVKDNVQKAQQDNVAE